MKKILLGALILGSSLAYGVEIRNDFLGKGYERRIFVEFDALGSEVEKNVFNNVSRFELTGFISGFSYGYEWENRVSFEVGVKVYGTEEAIEDDENIKDDPWQRSLYAGVGYRF